jgi:hypothetical protein
MIPVSGARVNQQPPMHQLAVLSTRWAAFFHSAPDEVHHSPFIFATDHFTFFFVFFSFAVVRFFIRRQMRFIIVLLFLLLTIVPFFGFYPLQSFFPWT